MSQKESWLPYILVPQCLELTMILKEPYWRKHCQLELRDWHHMRYKKVLGGIRLGKLFNIQKMKYPPMPSPNMAKEEDGK